MPTFKQVIEIKDRLWNRAVNVTVIALADAKGGFLSFR
jgi:hypothetical protein